jgi:hypothetical protein
MPWSAVGGWCGLGGMPMFGAFCIAQQGNGEDITSRCSLLRACPNTMPDSSVARWMRANTVMIEMGVYHGEL